MTSIVPGVRKIAVLRANALGDFVFVLPALAALRAAYPHAEITLLGKPWHAEFLAGRPGPVDRVVVCPPTRGVREEPDGREDPAERERFFDAMRADRFDLAIQLHGGGRYSNSFLIRLGARTTVGPKTPDAPPLDRWVPYVYYQPEILRYLEVVSLVGATTDELEPRLAVTERDVRESLAVVPEDDSPLVALHPGADDPRRRWPVEKFAAVGDALAREGARVVVTGTANERDVVEGVVEAMRERAEPLAGRFSLHALTGLLSRSALLVSNDTGPRHLAEAVGTRTVGIYWCGNAINAGPITRAKHRPLLSWVVECPVCGRPCTDEMWPARTGGTRCQHNVSFVSPVSSEDALAQALDLLCAAREEAVTATTPRPTRSAERGRRRIAVLRALQLGDLLCAVPAFRALRKAMPDAEVTLVGLPWAAEFVSRFDRYLDRFLELPGYPGLPERPPEPDRIPAFLEEARRTRFDLAIQLHGSGVVTNPLIGLLGAERTAGFFVPGAYCPDEATFIPYPEKEPEIRRLLRLLDTLGIPPDGEELEFPLRDADREELAQVPGARTLSPGDYVCIHPGARAADRRWPPQRFAAVADALARRGLRAVLTGSSAERDVVDEVRSAMREPALHLAGRTTLGALAVLLSDARLVVCNDTSVSHLAAALRVPSVVVFTGSDPRRWAPLDRGLHRAAPGKTPRAAARVLAEAEELVEGERAFAS